MSTKIYFRVFQTSGGERAHYINRRQYELMRLSGLSDGFFAGKDEIIYLFSRTIRQPDALAAAKHAYDKWVASNRPNISQIRELVMKEIIPNEDDLGIGGS